MMKFKKAVCAVLCAALLTTTLAFAGCSTPKDAMTVDGQTYSTGEYLAYLYQAFSQTYLNSYLSYYEQQGMDVWGQTYPYGEDDDAEQLKLDEYIKRLAQDMIIRQKALEKLMAQHGLSALPDDVKAADEYLATVKESNTLALGFSKENYAKMYKAVATMERGAFFGLYDAGGKREVPTTDIETYFNDNYLSYKIIEISLVDSDNKDLSEDEQKEIKDRLAKYLDMYESSKDFDKVIEQYEKDEEAKKEETSSTASTTAGTDSITAVTDTTTAATTAADSTTAASGSTTDAATTDSSTTSTTAAAEEEEEEEETDPNRRDIDAKEYGDEDFTNALKKVEINTAKVIEYKKGGSKNTAALVLRLDPKEVKGKTPEEVFEDKHDEILYKLKSEEFNAEVDAIIKDLSVEVNKTTIRKCDPKKFVG